MDVKILFGILVVGYIIHRSFYIECIDSKINAVKNKFKRKVHIRMLDSVRTEEK